MSPRRTPEEIRSTLGDAEQALYWVICTHTLHCECDVCILWKHVCAVYRTAQRPGWEGGQE